MDLIDTGNGKFLLRNNDDKVIYHVMITQDCNDELKFPQLQPGQECALTSLGDRIIPTNRYRDCDRFLAKSVAGTCLAALIVEVVACQRVHLQKWSVHARSGDVRNRSHARSHRGPRNSASILRCGGEKTAS